MPLDRRTLIAAGLSLAATPRVALAAPAVSRFPIWPATPPGMPTPHDLFEVFRIRRLGPAPALAFAA